MSISINYQQLAEKICYINKNNESNKKEEIIKSIKSQFYAIEEQLENELKIPIKKHRISERIELMEYIYLYKNYYYSREQIIEFVEKFYTEIKQEDILNRFLEFKGVNILFEKEYKNLLYCKKICLEKEDKNKVLDEIKDKIDKNEINLIKNINNCSISETLEMDLKKYYFRSDLKNDKKYSEYTTFINEMQLDMSIQYNDFIKRLHKKFYYENISDDDKKVIYGDLVKVTNRLEKIINEIQFMDSENRQDLMAIFYIRLKRSEIGRILKFENKLLSFLEEQSEIYKLKNYKVETGVEPTKITSLSKDIFLNEDIITKSQIRTLQSECKSLVPTLRNKYSNKLTMLNGDGKIRKVLLREIDLNKRSSKEKLEKQELDFKKLKLAKIINKMKKNIDLTNEEKIFVDTIVDRGIILENGNLSDSLMINKIDIKISEIILKIHYINNIFQISICIQNMFELLNSVLNKKRKK